MNKAFLIFSILVIAINARTQETIYYLDSAYNYSFSSTMDSTLKSKTYTYHDEDGMVISSTYIWDSNTNAWIIRTIFESSYDSSGNQTLNTRSTWDSELNDWLSRYKTESSYDANGNLNLEAKYKWDRDLNDWVGTVKNEFSYEVNGNQTLVMEYHWDPDLKDWMIISKNEFSYDAYGNHILSIIYTWNSNLADWILISKIEFSYDANDNQVLSIEYLWDANLNDWIRRAKTTASYDENGNQTLEAAYKWDLNLNDWVGRNKWLKNYDTGRNVILYENYRWDSNTNDWIGRIKFEYSFDTNGNQILMKVYQWDSNMNQWIIDGKSYKYFINNKYLFKENHSICQGDSIYWHGIYIDTSGIYVKNYQISETDKVTYEMTLTVDPRPSTYSISGIDTLLLDSSNIFSVPEDTTIGYSWFTENGEILSNPSGSNVEIRWNKAGQGYVHSFAVDTNGCVSDTAVFQVNIGEQYFFTDSISICEGDSLLWQDTYYRSSGIYSKNYVTVLQFDSIYELELSVLPRPNLFEIIGADTILSEQPSIYSAPENNGINYNWLAENGEILSYPSDSTAEIKWNNTGLGFIQSFAVDTNNCSSDTAEFLVNIGKQYLFIDTLSVCEGDSLLWQDNYYSTSGNYSENYKTVLQFDSIYELIFSVLPRPNNFSIVGQRTAESDQQIIYTVPSNTQVTYNWIIENGSIIAYPTDHSGEIQWGEPGDGYIYIYAADTNGCVSDTSSSKVAIGPNNVNSFTDNDHIRIFPNPANDILYISSPIELEVEIYDIMGRKLLFSRKNIIDVSTYREGIYLVRFKDFQQNVVKSQRIMIF